MRKEPIIKKLFEQGIPSIFQNGDYDSNGDLISLMLTYEHVIINTEENHYKFWAYINTKSGIKYVWGRIGGTPQETEKAEGDWEARKKMQSKIDKGYKELRF